MANKNAGLCSINRISPSFLARSYKYNRWPVGGYYQKLKGKLYLCVVREKEKVHTDCRETPQNFVPTGYGGY